MAFLVCLLFRESIGVAITKSFVIFVRKFFADCGTHRIFRSLIRSSYCSVCRSASVAYQNNIVRQLS